MSHIPYPPSERLLLRWSPALVAPGGTHAFLDVLGQRHEAIALQWKREVGHDRTLERESDIGPRVHRSVKEHESSARRQRDGESFGACPGRQRAVDNSEQGSGSQGGIAPFVERCGHLRRVSHRRERLGQAFQKRRVLTDE